MKFVIMDKSNTNSDKQFLAKILFTREYMEQKLIAQKVGVSESTISKWVNLFNWKGLRDRMLVGKEQILTDIYEQLAEMNASIKAKDKGQRFADNKTADTYVKLTASARNLETELAIADIVESGIRFIKFLQQRGTHEQVKDFSEIWNEFIQVEMKLHG